MLRAPEWLWVGGAVGVAALVIGVVGLLFGYPLLFPSLGPTLVLQVQDPRQPSARPYAVFAGHGIGIAVAMAAVALTGAGDAPPVLSADSLSWPRIWAAALGLGVAFAVQPIVRASHPPAAATVLLIALGGFAVTWRDARVLAVGVLLVALLGETARRLALARADAKRRKE